MLKTVVKLALAALIANAAWRIGTEYVAHFRFREAVRVAAVAAGPNDDTLREAIAREADRLGIPLTAGSLSIERRERRIGVNGLYRKTIEVMPGYTYPWTFNWDVEVFVAPSVNQAPGGR